MPSPGGIRAHQWRAHLLQGVALAVLLGAARVSPGETRLPVCHRPPGNPNNYATIFVGHMPAVTAHLAHRDLLGTCESACPAQLCTDGDACTAADGTWNDATRRCECTYSPATCDDHNPCTDDACALPGGCVHTPVPGRACNGGDACTNTFCDASGACVEGSAPDCDDGNPCTDDSCEPATGCVHTPLDGQGCDDGNACTSGDTCNAAAVCVGGSPMQCDDGNPCTDDSCDPVTTCAYTSNDANACDDGEACTSDDHCRAGTCMGTPYSCNTPDQCQQGTGACNGDGTCSYSNTPDGAICDDGDPCTGCPSGGCQSIYDINATLLDNQAFFCDGVGMHRYNGCFGNYGFHWSDVGSGPAARVDIEFQSGLACNVGAIHSVTLNGMTIGNMTVQGQCACSPTGSVTQTISFVNPNSYVSGAMNTFSITGVSSCEGFSSDGPFGGGIFARVTVTSAGDSDQCVEGRCVGGPPAPNGVACDDSSVCTINSHCSAGSCVGTAVNCGDQNGCTEDSCDPITGCVHTNSDGDVCDGTGTCQDGQCVQDGVRPCQEGNDPVTGSPWVVCMADASTAWLSANGSGYYHAEHICRMLGYSGVGLWGGTCGNVCGFCQPAVPTSCQNPGEATFNAGSSPPNICGTDEYGGILCTTVQWLCVF